MRARGRCWGTGIASALVLLLGLASGAEAQVTAVPQKNLAFGMLVPGVATRVLVSDVARRAEWILTGRGTPTLSFVLPASMLGPGGAQMPMTFVSGDAAWQRSNPGGGGGGMTTVDPNTPFSIAVAARQTVRLFLGGTATPAPTQAAGNYTATITLIIAQP